MSGQDSEQVQQGQYGPITNLKSCPTRGDYAWVPISEAMRLLIGTDRPSAVAKFLERCSAQNVRDWRRGKGGVPAWALGIIRARLQKLKFDADCLDTRLSYVVPANGPGSAENIRKFNQRRFAKSGNPAK